ncbi:UDP-N-acetylglucosamine--N-acetylmuramyl-(pentapeptide) pyrophosphoryl-undecaprenol N-acetylglucosamine transferase [Desulfosarcina sp. BuS5]|uniref:glycosyltransferase n=1 Tax=Desulfosarcina sp. BuS5 TaxID=933262 RepID=UPI00048A0B92|nr:glycosyltransferase [Desulfosarcina sp. BuS5]WDN87862.1 UDP-N-acetylglucosamine--N-acetylmuramyl-(pentapeptide) pyrophosphoryl-undecaprenol N-acetylglucosamine transferase [Desulfosarcina sp. BuS5]
MPNILILTSVVGGGHVFRDIAIAIELKKLLPPGYEFIFVSGDNAFQMLSNEGLKVEKIEGVSFPTNLGTIDFLKFYLILLRSEFIQSFQLRKLIKKYKPALIILDEFFFLTDYCKTWKIPVVFMCDFIGVPRSPFLHNPFRSSLEAFFDWLLFAHLPKKADKWIYIGDPDHILRKEWRSRINSKNILAVEPITKLQYTEPPSRQTARLELGFKNDETVLTVTVGCSGIGEYLFKAVNEAVPQLQQSINKLRVEFICGYGIEPEDLDFILQRGVNVHGYVKNIEAFYAASDVLVIQSGITTATECLMIGTPMVAVPITGHWEQEHTAKYLKKKAGTLIINGEDISSNVMADAIKRLVKTRLKKESYFKGNGHNIAAKAIADILFQTSDD